jgi:hypothetical protein
MMIVVVILVLMIAIVPLIVAGFIAMLFISRLVIANAAILIAIFPATAIGVIRTVRIVTDGAMFVAVVLVSLGRGDTCTKSGEGDG